MVGLLDDAGERQLDDVVAMLRIQIPDVDYLELWAAKLEVSERLATAIEKSRSSGS